uniref:Cms1 ribosomal small subunit homolog n=1 Tax=Kryptolebias marmoratus TaxID=37003 RepID=A0A3Q2ZXS4_KRYMA
ETEQDKHSAEETKRTKPEKRKRGTEQSDKAKKKKKDGGQKKKKTITDVLATSAPKPGCPADLQDLLTRYFSDKRSVIESPHVLPPPSQTPVSFCPKWAKLQKQHTEKSSAAVLIVCSSALRTIELIKQLTAFKGEAKAVKLFAKHIKIEEQVKLLQKGVTHIGVGTPGRIGALIEREGLSLQSLRYLILDWNWRDQKLRRMVDIPEIKLDLMKLLESVILTACKEHKVKIGLF